MASIRGWHLLEGGVFLRNMVYTHKVVFSSPFAITDTMSWEKVPISGPPPPARLDHAMCSVLIPAGDDQKFSTTSKNIIYCVRGISLVINTVFPLILVTLPQRHN